MRTLVLPLLAALALVASPADRARAETATAYMQRVANELIAASRSGSTLAFAAVIRNHADVPWLGLYSLGNYRAGLTIADRPTYYNGMVNFIARYAAQESPKYPVASGVVAGAAEETSEGVQVDSRVTLRTGESYDVRWLLVRRGQTFKVRDAQVVGFWMSPFLKQLFENYISENGGNPRALVIALNK
jgi:phospholipid transport system substrate-binding protein